MNKRSNFTLFCFLKVIKFSEEKIYHYEIDEIKKKSKVNKMKINIEDHKLMHLSKLQYKRLMAGWFPVRQSWMQPSLPRVHWNVHSVSLFWQFWSQAACSFGHSCLRQICWEKAQFNRTINTKAIFAILNIFIYCSFVEPNRLIIIFK